MTNIKIADITVTNTEFLLVWIIQVKVNKLNVGQSKQSVLQLFKHYSIRELSLADKLLQSYAEFVQSTNYTKSFVNIREPFYSELNKRFRYLTTLE